MKAKCVGPLGFEMLEDQARQVEALLKTAPRPYRVTKAVPETTEVIAKERSDVSLISTAALDRDNEVILPKGIDRSVFMQNPIVTFAHKYDELPVGRAAWVKSVERGLLAKTLYAKRPDSWEGSWLPDAIFSMTQEGILKGKSIGFLPTSIRAPTEEEIKSQPSWEKATGIIESSVLLEYAVAPIPVNQEALTVAVSKGLASKEILERLGINFIKPKKSSLMKAFARELEKIELNPEKIAQEIIDRIRGKI